MKLTACLYIAYQTLDYITTVIGVGMLGARELNPIIRLVGLGWGMILVKLTATVISLGICWLLAKDNKELAHKALRIITVIAAAPVVSNGIQLALMVIR